MTWDRAHRRPVRRSVMSELVPASGYRPSRRRTSRRSAAATSVSRPKRRGRTLFFFSSRGERLAWRRRSRPVPVTLKRFAAPRSVFIFGMSSSFLATGLCIPCGRRWCLGGRSAVCPNHSRAPALCGLGRSPAPRARHFLITLGRPGRGGLLGPLVRCQHHHHVATVEPRIRFHPRRPLDVLGHPIEDLLPELG